MGAGVGGGDGTSVFVFRRETGDGRRTWREFRGGLFRSEGDLEVPRGGEGARGDLQHCVYLEPICRKSGGRSISKLRLF